MLGNILRVACLAIALFKSRTRAEIFSAIAQMEPLLETHKRLISDLNNYITKEEKRLAVLKSHLELYKIEHEKAKEDIPNYLGNPINAFTLIKRLTTDLENIEDSIKAETDYDKNITFKHADVQYPTLDDLAGAVRALARLQTTYQLDVHDLAEGKLKHTFPMTAADCIDLARALYHLEDFKNSLSWGIEALRKLKETSEDTFTEIEILEYISFSYYMLEDLHSALAWTKQLLELDPNNSIARRNMEKLEKALAQQENVAEMEQRGDTGDEEPKSALLETVDEKCEALCRGDMEINRKVAKRLYCRYLTEHHPFLRLAPIKAEQVYINPDVFVFHEVLSDEEIELIKNMAMPRLKRAMFEDREHPGKRRALESRTSQTAWLRDEESDVIARVSQRVADMTGLSVMFAESLQVCNYGIGGHYSPHFDFERLNETNHLTKLFGNRIATLLFYMSDVAQGGATVFTELGLTVFPVKRAALFWLNLHPSGEGDTATRHAACPVLRGSKWVSNKWFRQSGQEFTKPCYLDDQESILLRKIPRAVPKISRYIKLAYSKQV